VGDIDSGLEVAGAHRLDRLELEWIKAADNSVSVIQAQHTEDIRLVISLHHRAATAIDAVQSTCHAFIASAAGAETALFIKLRVHIYDGIGMGIQDRLSKHRLGRTEGDAG
jgi:hypothetical protein